MSWTLSLAFAALTAGDLAVGAPPMAGAVEPASATGVESETSIERVMVFITQRDDDLDERAALAIEAHARSMEGQLLVLSTDLPAPPPDQLREVVAPTLDEPGVRGVVWIDVEPGKPIDLFIVPNGDDRVFGTRLEVAEDASATLKLESVANITAATTQALLGGISIAGISNTTVLVEATPNPVPTPTVQADEVDGPTIVAQDDTKGDPSWSRLTIGAGYAGNTYAPESTWQHAAALRLGWQPTPRVWLAMGYDVVSAAEVTTDQARLRVFRHPISLRASYGFRVGRRWSIPLGGRVVIDPTTQRTEALDDAFVAGSRSTHVQVGAGAVTGVMLEASRWLRVRLDVGADVMLGRSSYVVQDAGLATFLRPDPVRFIVGLSFDFTGVRR